jgi:hypothetical protein
MQKLFNIPRRGVYLTQFGALMSTVLAFGWTAPAVYSQVPKISGVAFGMIGLAESQTLRLSINAWPPNPIFGTPESCVAQLGFANSNGSAVGPTKTVSVSLGHGDFLDLNGAMLRPPSGPNFPPDPIGVEVRPVVTIASPLAGGPWACLANAEIVDSFSGFSLGLIPGVTAYPPDPVFGLQGVAWGQVLRLNLVAWPPSPIAPGPCLAQLSFVDQSGNPAGPAPKAVNLSSGHADFLAVAGASLVRQFGQRAELRPVVAILPGAAAPSVCAATAEVYDQFSGRTWAWWPPSPITPGSNP